MFVQDMKNKMADIILLPLLIHLNLVYILWKLFATKRFVHNWTSHQPLIKLKRKIIRIRFLYILQTISLYCLFPEDNDTNNNKGLLENALIAFHFNSKSVK